MKKILFISPFSPFSGSNGSGERVSQLMISAQKLGHEVHFFHLPGWDKVHQNCIDFLTEDKCHTVPSLKRKNSVAEELKSFSDEVVNFLKNYREELPTAVFDYLSHFATPKWSSHQWYSRLNAPLFSGLKQHLAELQKAKQFDIVMTSYLFTSSVLDSFDRSVLKVIDAHDDLIDREVHLLRHGIESDWGSLSEVQARMAMEKCDLLLGISERETSRHEQIVSGKSFCLGHVNTDDYQEKPFQVETPEILFVASDNPINQQSWSWFIKQVYPLLEVKIDFKINVLGSICLFKEQFKQRKKIKYIGPVENLKAHYRRSSMVINPCLGGTGVKIKSLEALAHGLPLVTTQYGASGLENLAQKCLLTASSAQEFAESTNSLLLNPALRSELGIRGRSFFSRYNQIQKSRLKDLLFLEKSSETFSEKVGCLIGKNYWSEPIVCAPENSASNSV